MTTVLRHRQARPVAGLRWATATALTDRRNRGRLLTMAIGVGACLFVLLIVVTIPSALSSMEERRAAAGTMWTEDGNGAFRYQVASVKVAEDIHLEGYWLDGPVEAPLPPGITGFPQHGELWVSPALDDLLASDPAMRLLLPGTVVGQVDPAALFNPYDLWFYGGTDLTSDPRSASSQGWGDGGAGHSSYFDPTYWTVLIAGTIVLIVPLLLILALASRFGAARRDRRSALLRLLGARTSQLRMLVVVEAVLASVLGIVIGGLLFLVFRAVSPTIRMGSYGIQATDLTPPVVPALVVLGVVIAMAIMSALIGARQAAVGPLGVLGREGRRPRVIWRILLVLTTIGFPAALAIGGWLLGRYDIPPALFIAKVGVVTALALTSVAALVGLLADVGARLLRPSSPALAMAARRITADGAVTTRAAAAGATVLAGVLILVGIFAGEDEQRPTNGYLELSGAAETNRADSELRAVLGDNLIRVHILNDSSSADPAMGPRVMVGTCRQLELDYPGTSCVEGDVFAVEADDRGDVEPPSVLTFGGATDNALTWSPPSDIVEVPTSTTGFTGVDYWFTPGYLESLDPDALDRVRMQVAFFADDAAREQLILQTPWLGSRIGDLLEPNYGLDFRTDMLPWLKVGIVVAGGFTLLIAGFAQILTAHEQLAHRRRAYALARATGVPLSTLRRSVVLGALWPAVIAAVLAVVCASWVAPLLQSMRGRQAAALDPAWVFGGIAALLLTTLAVALISTARLDAMTGPEALRTE